MDNGSGRSRALQYVLMALGTLCVTAAAALFAFALAAGRGDTYFEIQTGLGVDAGITAEEMYAQDILLGRYIAGDSAALEESAFNERETAHMRDVYRIFEAIRHAALALALAGAALLAGSFMVPGARIRGAVLGALTGALLFFIPVTAAAVWAMSDFSAAFRMMHTTLFSNDLWLLDPRTDLMIRMLPEEFFMAIGARLGAAALIAALAAPPVCVGVCVFASKAMPAGVRRGFSRSSR